MHDQTAALYTLSLAVVPGADTRTVASRFLTALAQHGGLDAAIWYATVTGTASSDDSPVAQAGSLELLAATDIGIPHASKIDFSHPLWQRTRDGVTHWFAETDGLGLPDAPNGAAGPAALAVIPLGDNGLLLVRGVQSEGVRRLIESLWPVAERLTGTLYCAVAQTRARQLEARLTEVSAELANERARNEQHARRLSDAHSERQALIHVLPDLVWLKDADGVYLACNNRFERFFGAPERDIVGKTDFDFVDRELAESFREHDRAAIRNVGPSVNEEWVTFAEDGHRELLETTKTPMYDRYGHLIGVLGIGHSITGRKGTEETLRATEEQSRTIATMLRLMCDNVPDMIWAKGLDKRFLFANKALCEQLLNANDVREPIGKTNAFFFDREVARHPDDPNWHTFGIQFDDSDEITLQRGAPTVFEESGYVRGRFVYLEIHKSPFFDAEGKVIGTVGCARDVTDRKRIEAELDEHRRHLEELVHRRSAALVETEAKASLLLESTADGLYGVDTEGRITFINPAACRMLGYSAAEVVGLSAHALFHHNRHDGLPYPADECPGHEALLSGREIRVDNQVYWHRDGRAIPVMYAMHPIVQNGRNTGAVVSVVDISEQHAAAEAREQALIAAEHLARVKSEFLANMSHEIRTPLNGVLGFAQIGYRSCDDPEKARNAFEKILTSGSRLLGVVNDILDFSKIEAGKLSIEQTEMTLDEVIDHAVTLVNDRAQAKHLELYVEKADDLPAVCVGDPLRLGQILLNLLSNAVKFTETGSVTLSALRDEADLVFRVADTGMGVEQEQVQHLFNPFQQADGSSTRRFGGTGLGLAICKRLLELMDGDIRVESSPGAGSVFEFRVPYIEPLPGSTLPKRESPIVPPLQTTHPLGGVSILVVEDDAINQMVLEHNLTEDGAIVTMAGNGREAVDFVMRDGPDAYDVVLMDVQMPEMDGYEATRRLLQIAPGLPIIGQTAHVLGDEREKCFAVGMVEHVAKPTDPDVLTNIVVRLVSSQAGR
ncbi:PAS domain S-box protein [Propionivibrio soli]|uniref:PAS domain S-box protein n=1 Tax=Propionivibrio soli TaxID=2976531 RepID=UPI0021E93C4E|nr:PAS domain S-box protein [Propionivibrio soli]